MSVFYDSQNQPYTLSERRGGGGEGTVYACDDVNLVAKIYHEPLTEEKAEKLLWMAAHKNERLLKVAAWVVDVLRDAPDGKIVGFLMPNINAKEIHELYSLKSRRVYFPDATWHFLAHTAANLARAFYILHRDAHIMGDVNHGNCVVMRDGTVKLIDCDSYSIKTGELRYPCEVGVATHLAPELQGVNLREIERENKHDNFGLAVIIFQLLFLGRHPFAGNYLGDEDKSLEDCIREFRFAYGDNAAIKNVRQPPGTLPLAAVSPRVALMFERAFLTEDRPEPREWIEALEDLSRNLKQCGLHPGHLYFDELKDCPWCEIEMQTGLMLFPFITSGEHLSGDQPFNIFTVENLIASFGIQNTLPAKLPPPARVPPSPEMIDARRERRKTAYLVVTAHFFALLFMNWMFGVGASSMLGIIMAFCLIVFLRDIYASVRQPINGMLSSGQQQLEKIEKQRNRAEVPPVIGENLVKIRSKIAAYQSVQRKSVSELKSLQADVSSREFYRYLRSKKITDAQISGVTAPERKMLAAAGVKTAAEIDEIRLRDVYKIDDETIPKLLEWRERLNVDFDGDENAVKNIKAEQTQFINRIGSQRRRIERDIEQLLILLRAGAVYLKKDQQMLTAKAEELAKQISQARTELKTVGSNLPAAFALILFSVVVPMSGIFVPINNEVYKYPTISAQNGIISAAAPPPLPKNDDSNLNIPSESMTDAEISDLSQTERMRLAENLYNAAITYNYDNIDRVRAEKLSRQAIRFAADQPRFINQLGYALYGRQKYGESLKNLNRSLKLDPENSETKIFISMNYLATDRFKDSVKILKEVVEKNPDLFEAYYSLGLAFNGLKNYAAAEDVFRRAAELRSSDADIHYQLGICLYKLNKKEEMRNEYHILLSLNPKTAQKLDEETNFDAGSFESSSPETGSRGETAGSYSLK